MRTEPNPIQKKLIEQIGSKDFLDFVEAVAAHYYLKRGWGRDQVDTAVSSAVRRWLETANSISTDTEKAEALLWLTGVGPPSESALGDDDARRRRAYLRQALLNEISTDYARHVRRDSDRHLVQLHAIHKQKESAQRSPLDILIESEEVEAVRSAIATLPSRYQEILEHYLQGEPSMHIAARLGISESTARVMRHRALRMLRKVLGGPLDD
jgi:RNA polymerase sigma factor (sigma-70 family)